MTSYKDAPLSLKGSILKIKEYSGIVRKMNEIENEQNKKVNKLDEDIDTNTYSIPYKQWSHELFAKQYVNKGPIPSYRLPDYYTTIATEKRVMVFYDCTNFRHGMYYKHVAYNFGEYYGKLLHWNLHLVGDYQIIINAEVERDYTSELRQNSPYVKPFCVCNAEYDDNSYYYFFYVNNVTTDNKPPTGCFSVIRMVVENTYDFQYTLKYQDIHEINDDLDITVLGVYDACSFGVDDINPTMIDSRHVLVTVETTNGMRGLLYKLNLDPKSEVLVTNVAYVSYASTSVGLNGKFYNIGMTPIQEIEVVTEVDELGQSSTTTKYLALIMTIGADTYSNKCIQLYSVMQILFKGLLTTSYDISISNWKNVEVELPTGLSSTFQWSKIVFDETFNEFVITYDKYNSESDNTDYNYSHIVSLNLAPTSFNIDKYGGNANFTVSYTISKQDYVLVRDSVFDSYEGRKYTFITDGTEIYTRLGNAWNDKPIKIQLENEDLQKIVCLESCGDGKVFALVVYGTSSRTSDGVKMSMYVLNYDMEAEWKSRIDTYKLANIK